MILKRSAVQKLEGMGRVKQIFLVSIVITGVGGQQSVAEGRISSICLPLHNGKMRS